MANFAGSPERYEFGKLTFVRGEGGAYTVSSEGIREPIASVTPYAGGQLGWLHLETGQSGYVSELGAAGAAIASIEATRTD